MDYELSGKIDALAMIVAKLLKQSTNDMRTSAVGATYVLLNDQNHPDYRRGVEAVRALVANASNIEFRD